MVDNSPVCVSPEAGYSVSLVGIVVTSHTGFANRSMSATMPIPDLSCDVEALEVAALHPDERRMLREALDEDGPRLTLDELRRSLDAG